MGFLGFCAAGLYGLSACAVTMVINLFKNIAIVILKVLSYPQASKA
jgi:hypothetical protein